MAKKKKMDAKEMRELLEGLPCPFCTDNVTDETLDDISEELELEMKPWYEWKRNGDVTADKVEEKWWEELENIAVEKGIPYYEDLD